MSPGPTTMWHTHEIGAPDLAWPALVVMWVGMMTAMMAPTVWPWAHAFGRLSVARGSVAGRAAATGSFLLGYVAAWTLYAIVAAAAQLALARSSALDASGALAPLAGSAVLVAAGAFQFAPLKRACLTHCRHPLTYLLAKWRNGPVSGVRLGLAHGAFCVGCCWALMATSLAVGMTSLWWMVALAAAVFVEQVVPHGHRIRIPLGIALIACGVLSAQASS